MTMLESNINFNILIKLSEYGYHTIKCKAFEPSVTDTRKFGMCHSCQLFGFTRR